MPAAPKASLLALTATSASCSGGGRGVERSDVGASPEKLGEAPHPDSP